MLGTLKKCCCCLDVRKGSFIIAYILLISRIIHLVISSLQLAHLDEALTDFSNHHLMLMHNDLEFSRLVISLSILLMVFELLITCALVNGLHKKIQDQIQMFYTCAFVFDILRLVLGTMVLMRYGKLMARLFGTWQWFSFTMEVLAHIIYVYFLMVIRSYYFRLRQETSVERYNVFSNTPVQLKVNK